VTDAIGEQSLTPEEPPTLAIGREGLVKHFHGDGMAVPMMHARVDGAHATHAEQPDESVTITEDDPNSPQGLHFDGIGGGLRHDGA
jgi:hypothetical protein